MSDPDTYRCFGNGVLVTIKPPRPEALAFWEALTAAFDAEKALEQAKADVPSYTGQWADIDYYGDELVAYNRAIDALYAIIDPPEDEPWK